MKIATTIPPRKGDTPGQEWYRQQANTCFRIAARMTSYGAEGFSDIQHEANIAWHMAEASYYASRYAGQERCPDPISLPDGKESRRLDALEWERRRLRLPFRTSAQAVEDALSSERRRLARDAHLTLATGVTAVAL